MPGNVDTDVYVHYRGFTIQNIDDISDHVEWKENMSCWISTDV